MNTGYKDMEGTQIDEWDIVSRETGMLDAQGRKERVEGIVWNINGEPMVCHPDLNAVKLSAYADRCIVVNP